MSGETRLPEHVSLNGLEDFGARKSTFERATADVERVEREYIVMHQIVIPRRAGAIVTEIVAGHFRIAGEPAGEVIDPLPGAARLLSAR